MPSSKSFPKAFTLMELSIIILAIGLLIGAITQSSNLYKKYRLSNAQSFTQSSEINGIDGLVLWLDVTSNKSLTNSLGSTNLKDGDLIQSWKSQILQSKNVFDFTQSLSAKQPTYKEKGINGLPTLFFKYSATATLISQLGLAHNFSLSPSEFTIFSVIQPIFNTVTTKQFLSFKGASGRGFILNKKNTTYLTTVSNALSFQTWSGSAWSESVATGMKLSTPMLATAMRDSANSTAYRNGTAGSVITANYEINSETNSFFYIGGGFDGYISEIIMFDRALSSEDRQLVEAYLVKKYEIK